MCVCVCFILTDAPVFLLSSINSFQVHIGFDHVIFSNPFLSVSCINFYFN